MSDTLRVHTLRRTKKVVDSCRLLAEHIDKYLTGHGRKHIYYDERLDYVDATLNTQEDDIPDVLNAMMQNLLEKTVDIHPLKTGISVHFLSR